MTRMVSNRIMSDVKKIYERFGTNTFVWMDVADLELELSPQFYRYNPALECLGKTKVENFYVNKYKISDTFIQKLVGGKYL